MIALLLALLPAPATIDDAVDAAIKRGDCCGAVVIVIRQNKITHRKAYGDRSVAPEREVMTPNTISDLASLTKPIATATSIMHLMEAGKLAPSDLVAKHWPAFAANGKETVTIEHLLLHTSGLTADNALADYSDGKAKAMERIAALKLEAAPGTRFRYSDVGFLVLGELVERVSGLSLDRCAAKHIFTPLDMKDTGFNPSPEKVKRIAPTGNSKGMPIRGHVHDPRASALGGVAGHAGLFSTADDLARFARMLQHGGELDGVRVLSKNTVEAFLKPRPVPEPAKGHGPPNTPWRSWGWDVDTGYSSPRGTVFGRTDGFGHTGFTGTSLWVDRPSGTVVILLTSRLHPDDKGNSNPLRRTLGTLAAGK